MHINRTVAMAALTAVLMLPVGGVSAQAGATPITGKRVDGELKGTVGLGLIGMELGLILAPTLKLQDEWWAWVLFPLIGAAGGVVGGVLAFEGGSPDPNVTVPLLAVGVGLIVPAVVGSLSIAARRDSDAMALDEAALDTGTGLVRLNAGNNFVRVPALSVVTRTHTAEQRRDGVAGRRSTALHVPLLSGRF